jgi:hypothetical protein
MADTVVINFLKCRWQATAWNKVAHILEAKTEVRQRLWWYGDIRAIIERVGNLQPHSSATGYRMVEGVVMPSPWRVNAFLDVDDKKNPERQRRQVTPIRWLWYLGSLSRKVFLPERCLLVKCWTLNLRGVVRRPDIRSWNVESGCGSRDPFAVNHQENWNLLICTYLPLS